jgi:enterochelin esterase-like enzyme
VFPFRHAFAALAGASFVVACSQSAENAAAGGGPSSTSTTTSGGTGGGAGSTPDVEGGATDASAGVEAAAEASDANNDADFPIGEPGTMGDGDFTIGPSYPMQPELTDQGAPKGKSFRFIMDSTTSAIFRGDDKTLLPQNQHTFARGIDVYVPAQYKDGTPALLLIIQDGPGDLALIMNALDNLTISTDPARKLPAFVAIAVQNGGGDGKGSERGLEYDTMSDRYARFIQTEILPAVLANPSIKAAYPNLTFTDNPEGKATLGCSSGGAAALIMGWFRPDLFRRIITYSGTFVDQQDDNAPEEATYPLGAWEFHSSMELIANSPRKPLRVFLNVNDADNGATAPESGYHNWVIANQRTAAALKASGYHYRYLFGQQAGHCQANVRGATLADTLVWMWRGFPAP